jgi:hypothetical protein
MKFLFELPIWLGLIIISVVVAMVGLVVVTQVKKVINQRLTK